ncbi:MAG: CRTAC1 family protein [Candidatus Latescibacterota bacterium]
MFSRRSILLLILSLAAGVPAWAGTPQYVEVTREAGLDFRYTNGASGHKYLPEAMGSGAAFFDADRDGDLDLFIVNGAYLGRRPSGDAPSDAFYRSRGDGTFENATAAAALGDTAYGMGAAVGDYDNDDDLDLYVTNFGPNALHRNRGDGTFEEVTAASGTGDPGWGTNAAFVDYDHDGDLDLYVANYMDFRLERNQDCRQSHVRAYCGPTAYPGQSGVLYRNEGDGTFADVTRQAGVYTTAGRQLGAIFGDYDNDGDQDLFVANDRTPRMLFRNDGDGTFSDVAPTAGVAYNEDGAAVSSMGADWGDYDNDGHLDVVVATFQWVGNQLFHNDGDGFFTDVSFATRLAKESLPYLGMTIAFLDYDNDGYLDLFAANGHLDENVREYDSAASYAQANQLLRNQGDGTFARVTEQAGPGLRAERVSHGAVFGDYDNDGDVDIFVSASDTPHCTLLRNDGGNTAHWLMVRTVGTRGNRDGIGARLRLTAGGRTQIREVRSGYGYLGANDLRVHFGLGQAGRAERLEIRWPGGDVQVLENLAADQLLVVREPER